MPRQRPGAQSRGDHRHRTAWNGAAAAQLREALAEPGRERQRVPKGTTARNFTEKPMPASRP